MRTESSESATALTAKAAWWTPRLASPLIAAAIIRLALLAMIVLRSGGSLIVSTDTLSYLDPGRSLLLHGSFTSDGVPNLLRTPGYPIFLAITSLAGLPVAAFIQVILSVLTGVIVWKLARAVGMNDRIALGAAWLFAFEPIGISCSVQLLSETFFLALFLLSMERLVTFLQSRRLPVLAVAGLWLGAATLIRPVTYYLPVALALGLLAVLRRERGLRWKAPAVLLITVLPWLAAWQMRNWLEAGYKGFSSITEINLYSYSAAEVLASLQHRELMDVRRELGVSCPVDCNYQYYLYPPYKSLHPEQADWSQSQHLAFLHTEALRILGAHKAVYLRLCAQGVFKAIFRLSSGSFDSLLYPERGSVDFAGSPSEGIALARAYPLIAMEKIILTIVMLVLYLFAARGVRRSNLQSSSMWLLLGVSLYFIAISGIGSGTAVDARYRLPIMPFVCIFAAAGLFRSKSVQQNSPHE